MNIVAKIILGLCGISLVVFVHELGHFFSARIVGIGVETVSIGFGRRLVGFMRKGTDFRLSIFPFGGYCRLKGEREFRKALEDGEESIPMHDGSFHSAPPWRKILVSLAGPVCNVLFAVLIFFFIAWAGYEMEYGKPRIILASEWFQDPGPADEAGLRTGDLITAVDGKAIERFDQLRRRIIFSPGDELSLSVLRSGRSMTLLIKPQINPRSGGSIGVYEWRDPVLGPVSPGSPAEQAGLLPGDRILSVNGIRTPHSVAVALQLSDRKTAVPMVLQRDGYEVETSLPPPEDESYGISYERDVWVSPDIGPLRALGAGFAEAHRTLEDTASGIRMLFRGLDPKYAAAGPIRLTYITGEVAAAGFDRGLKEGFRIFFEFLALVSVSLGVINLLPIPIMDGGQILFFLLEILCRRRFSPKSLYRYQFAGTMIVLTLAVLLTAGDVMFFLTR